MGNEEREKGFGAAEERAILGVLARAGLISSELVDRWRLEVARGGLNTRVFVAMDPGGRPALTVRLARLDRAGLLSQEERALRDLARASCACAPAPFGLVEDPTLPGGALLAHAYVPGAAHSLEDVGTEARVLLGRCLATVHARGRSGYTIWPSRQQRSGSRLDAFRARLASLDRYQSAGDAVLGERVRPLLKRLRRLRPLGDGWDRRSFALLHGDLSVDNILWDGDAVRLIDWEYSRAGDPAEDLAYLLSEQPVEYMPVLEISGGYVAAGGVPDTLSRMTSWRPLVALDAALWWADYTRRMGEEPASHREVLVRLTRAEWFTENR